MGTGAFSGWKAALVGVKAGADLSAAANQFKWVKFDAAGDVIAIAAATDKPAGVLYNRPKLSEEAEVYYLGQVELQADAALNEGDLIGTSADGQADAKVPGTDTTEFIAGQVLSAAAAAGDRFSAMINCASLARAA